MEIRAVSWHIINWLSHLKAVNLHPWSNVCFKVLVINGPNLNMHFSVSQDIIKSISPVY